MATRCSTGGSGSTGKDAPWDKCGHAACTGRPSQFTRGEALLAAKNAALAEGLPWRLPNVKELSLLVDERRIQPAIDTTVFIGATTDTTWTSTHLSQSTGTCWYVDFNYGNTDSTLCGYDNAVRLLRDP